MPALVLTSTFHLAVTVAPEKITLLIFPALLLLLLSFTSQSGAPYSSLSYTADFFLAARCSQRRAFGRPGRLNAAYLSRPIITCLCSFQVQPFSVALEGASFNAAANPPAAQLPEIMLHLTEQTLHCFWPHNLLLELIKMFETSPLLCQR